jgi:hypothetical protein
MEAASVLEEQILEAAAVHPLAEPVLEDKEVLVL